jgi:hypothetical protein
MYKVTIESRNPSHDAEFSRYMQSDGYILVCFDKGKNGARAWVDSDGCYISGLRDVIKDYLDGIRKRSEVGA